MSTKAKVGARVTGALECLPEAEALQCTARHRLPGWRAQRGDYSAARLSLLRWMGEARTTPRLRVIVSHGAYIQTFVQEPGYEQDRPKMENTAMVQQDAQLGKGVPPLWPKPQKRSHASKALRALWKRAADTWASDDPCDLANARRPCMPAQRRLLGSPRAWGR